MPEEEIRDRFWQFVEDCPSGFLTKDHFIQLASDMLGPEAETMGETIFKVTLQTNPLANYKFSINSQSACFPGGLILTKLIFDVCFLPGTFFLIQRILRAQIT